MDPTTTLPLLLAIAWLTPLASFALIVLFGSRMGKGGLLASYVATAAIGTSCLLSLFALFVVWPELGIAPLAHHDAGQHGTAHPGVENHSADHPDAAATATEAGNEHAAD